MAEKQLVSLLEQLVAIPSVNPGDADDRRIAGEAKLAGFLAKLLEKKGFRTVREEVEPGRPNLLASFGPEAPRRTLLLESHLDTVGVSGMARGPFAPQIENGRLFGRGACDTKGPMAAALVAMEVDTLERLANAGWRVLFAGAMGEESGNRGAERMAAGDLRADQAIVLEPTKLAIIHAHKGTLWFEVEVEGRAGHGSHPEGGVNAVTGMVRVMDFLQRQAAADAARRDHPLLGRPSLNIGSIRGGTMVNIVPDRCVMQVDRRTLPEESHGGILDAVRAELGRLEKAGGITAGTVRVLKDGTPFLTGADSALVRSLKESCLAAGVGPRTEGAAWYSDAGPLARICREIVVFGPGDIGQAHTADEFIDLDSLQAGCDVLRHFLRRLAADSD